MKQDEIRTGHWANQCNRSRSSHIIFYPVSLVGLGTQLNKPYACWGMAPFRRLHQGRGSALAKRTGKLDTVSGSQGSLAASIRAMNPRLAEHIEKPREDKHRENLQHVL